MEEKKTETSVHIITGAINSGKTTELRERIEKWRNLGKMPGGIITEAEWKGGIKSAFFVRPLGGREKALVAARKEGIPKTGKPQGLSFEFYQEGFDIAARWIHKAWEEGADPLCIDELGPLELSGGGHWPALVHAVYGFGGTITVVVRKELVEEFCRLFNEMGKRVVVEEVSCGERKA
ncbi:MAG: nucleoside-triphosphatase [Sediminispirochaetaceae bacterium]